MSRRNTSLRSCDIVCQNIIFHIESLFALHWQRTIFSRSASLRCASGSGGRPTAMLGLMALALGLPWAFSSSLIVKLA